jgi:hypothetical protein
MGMRRIVLLLASTALAVLLVSGVAWAATITFAPVKNYPAGDYPVAVAAADLDKDGDTDIAAVNQWLDKVSVLKRRSDGTFAAPVKYATADDPVDIVGREDFDSDGDIDLATVNRNSNSISVLLNKGNGTFAAQRKYTAGAKPSSIESGRFDGDGDWDLVTVNKAEGSISVLLNKGNGTFAAQSKYTVGRQWDPSSVDRADLDGDGDEDIAVGLSSFGWSEAPGVAVLLGRGNGTFSVPQRYGGDQGFYETVERILAEDLDGDGDRDLATTGHTGPTYVVLNNGNGTFQTPPRNYAGGDIVPSSLTEADFDRDGDVDLATTSGGGILLLENAGNATMSYQPIPAGSCAMDMTRARMNGDNKPDLVWVNGNCAPQVSVLINTTY